MKLLLVVLALLSVAFCASYEYDEEVLVLTEKNFDDAIKEFSPLLVEFYAPWCGHCKKLAPEYAKAASALKEEGLKIAKVDATENRDLSERFGVRGFPTLKFFKGEEPVEYNGGRTKDEIVSWIMKRTGPVSKEMTTVAETEKFIADNEVVAMFFGEEGEEYTAFTNVAMALETVAFAHTSDVEVMKKYGITAPKVVMFRQFDEPRVDFEGKYAELKEFVELESVALVMEFTQENTARIFSGRINRHFLCFNTDESLFTMMREVAPEYKGQAMFIHVDASKDENERVMQYFGVTKDDAPAMVLVDMSAQPLKKFMFEQEFSAENIAAFAKSFFDGELKPFLKSEEIPETNDEAVKVVVGKNFEDVVLDQEKDVMIVFHAPWCGHCKNLLPIYEEVAEKLSGVETLVLTAMDATENEIDHPDVNIKGFPTVKFFPAGTTKAVDFEGERNAEAIISFLKEKATNKFEFEIEEDDEDFEEIDEEDMRDEL
eukprot:TRINITY_DN291_c0_g1_i1.p1 TRINITY_DN291_c0_g1~~TRINITY_DN291_c0_g1_i1.p1  ORF type:complete len:494 (-),score=146.28 TRINITY_DN291_c0_g1_i1:158-1618(-)